MVGRVHILYIQTFFLVSQFKKIQSQNQHNKCSYCIIIRIITLLYNTINI
uniref:Uncharacterized protein n=1 Tax=Anguilla anguilla TaxID=7936 RepID=A0A0E9VQ83_ANGAN